MAMKKYIVLMHVAKVDENGKATGEMEYKELPFFANDSKEIKKLEGFKNITSSERVSHPSPDVMQRALIANKIDLATFYNDCDTIEKNLADAAAKAEAAMTPEQRKEKEAKEKEALKKRKAALTARVKELEKQGNLNDDEKVELARCKLNLARM